MNKTTIIAIATGIIIIAGGLMVGMKFLGNKKPVSVTPTPASLEELPADSKIEVTLVPDTAKQEVTMTIKGLEGNYTGLDYEFSYDTDKGPKGTLSGSKPIDISGKSEFTRQITLGTCSRNVCTYDTGVANLQVALKLYPKSGGNPQVLKKAFEI